MEALWLPRVGPPEVFEVRTAPDPEPRAGEVRIRVRASGVNWADVMARLGLYPDRPPLPCVIGYEVAGEVDAVGPDVHEPAPGTRVVALTRFGGYADTVCVPAPQALPIPERMSFAEAAALPVNYLTAYFMLFHFGNVQRGERVLVHGAAGGVGVAAIQLCRIAGAEILGTASASKHGWLHEAGVSHTIDYRTQDFVAAVREATAGRGVDLVLDPVGTFRQSYRCLAPLGRLVCFGFSTAAAGKTRTVAGLARSLPHLLAFFHPLRLMNDNKAVIGFNLGHLWGEGRRLRAALEALLDHYRQGRIAPVVARTFPLRAIAAAHHYLQDRQNVGKVVLTAGGE